MTLVQSREPRVIKATSSAYLLTTTLVVDRPISEVFRFFSEATNLDAITPPWLRFRILTPLPIPMHEGALIDYSLRLHGITVAWQSRIEDWRPGVGFVDTQVKGPFKYWRHEHRFSQLEGGSTLIEDSVEYRTPGGWLIDRLFVRRDVLRIFRYRRQRIQETFG